MQWLHLSSKYTYTSITFKKLQHQTEKKTKDSNKSLFSSQLQDKRQPKSLDIHHSYDYLVSTDLQSLQCYEQLASTFCDLRPSGGRSEIGAACSYVVCLG